MNLFPPIKQFACTNMRCASSSTEDVNLSHDDTVDLNNQAEVNVEEIDGSNGVSPTKILGNKSTILPEISIQNAGESLVE